MSYTVEIESRSGAKATKEYDIPAYMLMIAVEGDLRDYPECRIIRIWKSETGYLLYKHRVVAWRGW